MRLPTSLSLWVVDDDPILLEAMQCAFRRYAWPVETFQSGSQLRRRLVAEVPSCLIVDLQLGDDNGLALLEHVRNTAWPAPAILMSGHLTIPLAVQAMRGGAAAVLEKPFTLEQMCREIDELLPRAAGEVDRLRRHVAAQQSLELLTTGQRAVLGDIVDCRPQKQIAKRQGIALRTVEKRKREIFDRLQVKTFTELLDLVRLADGLTAGRAILPASF